MRKIGLLLALLFVSVSSVRPAYAQTSADILGRVADDTGGVLPGATVTITNTRTNDVRTAVANATGDYLFTLLPIGPYVVKIELQGFQSQSRQVTLAAGDRIRVDGKLLVGNLTETVQVTSESPLLQTDKATLSTTIQDNAVEDLPLNGRNVIRLVQLVPGGLEGNQNALSSGNRPDDRRPSVSVQVNGTNDTQNNFMIDGMDNNERSIGTVGIHPSPEALAQVQVQTNLYSAEGGRTGGGVINMITKSGSNQFRGSAFDYVQSGKFNSRDYFATTDPVLTQNQFGGSLEQDVLFRGF